VIPAHIDQIVTETSQLAWILQVSLISEVTEHNPKPLSLVFGQLRPIFLRRPIVVLQAREADDETSATRDHATQ
jgi:hypothetical protein